MKPGYKQTEVGVIPEDWEEKSIRSVCKLINGRGFKPHEWKSNGLPIIRIQNLNGSEDFNYFEGPYAKKLEVENGQLLFAWSGSRGTSFGPHVWNGSLGLLNYHTWKVQVDGRSICTDFFLHALKQLTKFIEDRAHGASALVHTQKWEMEGFTFPMPPTTAEQRAIATALSDVDALLAALDRLIAKKRDLKQAAMQQLLTGQTRLPGFKGEWVVKRLGDLGATYGGLTGKTKNDFGDGSARYITFMNVMTNVVIDRGIFERVRVSPTESQNYARKGDLFFNGSSETPEEVALCAVLLDEVEEVYLNSFCFGFRFRENTPANGLFFAYYLRSTVGRELMKSLAQGSTRYNLSKVALLNSSLRLPPLPEQTAIAEVLNDMDAELVGLEQRRDKTRALKQGMMQELLTGRTRLV
jgi:type I restriction enzyme S subunit